MSKRRLAENEGRVAKKKKRQTSGPPPEDEEDDNSALSLSQHADFSTNNQEAEVGIIEKVSVKNFMCHSRLEVNMGPHVNFIVGRNGSGKSAVVAALVVGLGGKASMTSRGSAIKGFIKNGKSSGEVQIKLRNRGPDAYKHDLYGDSITVQRKFTTEGSSKYTLLSKAGQLVSDKREELFHILDQFNIQVDNPVAILNQETSRNFLNSKSPHDKYKFFLKATQLETMKHDYAIASEHKTVTQEIISLKEKTLPTLEKEVLQWEQKFKSLDAIDDLKKKVKKLKNEMAWALVVAKEKGLEPIKKKLEQEDSRTPKFLKKVDEVKENLERHNSQHRAIQDQIVAISEEVQELEPRRQGAKQAMQRRKDTARQAQNESLKVQKDLKTCVRDRELVEERIKEIRNSAQHDYEAERREREEKIDGLGKRKHDLESQLRTTEHQKNQFRDAVTKYTNDGYRYKRDEQGITERIDQTRQQVNILNSSRSDRLKRFGPFIPNIIKRIDEYVGQRRFHQRPRGPLGACFQLRDPNWAVAVESCLKALMHAFCCSDHHDEKVLEEIFRMEIRDRKHPSIIVSRFLEKRHDISRNAVHSEYPCILDVLDIDDPVVANTLIDQRSVENIILIADNKEARHVMQHTPPRNCRQAYTKVGDEIYCHPTFRYYSSNIDKPKYLSTNVDEQIAIYENEMRQYKQDLDRLRQQHSKLKEDIRRNSLEEKKCDTQYMKIQEAIQNINFEVHELRSIEDPAPIDIATLEEEVSNYSDQISTLSSKKEVALGQAKEQQQLYMEAEKLYRSVEAQLKTLTDKADPLKEEDGHTVTEIELAKNHKKHYEGKLMEHKRTVSDLRKNVADYEAELSEDLKKATAICPERVRTRRTPSNLESEIVQTIKQITTEEKSRGNAEEITRKYDETKESFMKIRKEVLQLKRFIDRLMSSLQERNMRYCKMRGSYSYRLKMQFVIKSAMIKAMKGSMQINHKSQEIILRHLEKVMCHRQQQYKQFRSFISVRAKYFFVVLLSNRNYMGKMSFNHEKESLEMAVQPTTGPGEGAKDLKSLSGGERSFSTVCFILALWDAMESPFRCLDEFDVFMDMVNRRISMDMMMEVARVQTGRQFIFLTPQDMSQLSIGVDSRIFRMPDPDRVLPGQTTLPYGDQEEQET